MSKKRKLPKIVYTSLAVFLGSLFWINFPAAKSAYSITNQSIIVQTNSAREDHNLPVLEWNPKLSTSAWHKAKDMCQKGYWAHTAPDGTTGWDYMKDADYVYTYSGENLARNYTDDRVVQAWMDSPTHRDNILNNRYRDIGVAVYECDDGTKNTRLIVAHYGKSAY